MALSDRFSPQSGADIIRMENPSLAITILPAAGGNISAITDKRSGRNWLWQNPHIPISNDRSGEDYGRHLDSGGWDEILLSMRPDHIDLTPNLRYQIEDHGDLVRKCWTATTGMTPGGDEYCDMLVIGDVLSYEFRRVVTLRHDAPQLDFEYSLKNNDEYAWPWYWCAHALIDIQPNMFIRLPDGLPLQIANTAEEPAVEQHWPTISSDSLGTIDLSRSFAVDDATEAFARKIFLRAPASGTVSIVVPDSNECLTMSFDPEVLPWLGLWINNRGWSGCESEPYLNLGLEPATTPCDRVSQAIADDAVRWLQPGESCRWSLRVELAV